THHLFTFFFSTDTALTDIYTLSLHDALPIFFKSPRRRLAHAKTTVTDEMINTSVLTVASGMFSPSSRPCGQCGTPLRRRISDEKSAPKSITSDARKSQIPSLAL